MKKLTSHNNWVICTPIKEAYAKSKKVGSLDMLSAPSGLAALTVLVDGEIKIGDGCGEILFAGTTVYVRAEQYITNWAKQIKECDEIVDKDGKPVKFIIVPGTEIVFTSSEYVVKPDVTSPCSP